MGAFDKIFSAEHLLFHDFMIFREGDVMHSRKNEKVHNIDSILSSLVLSLQKSPL